MTDNSPRAVYLRMLDAYNDGTPDSYGSDKFLDHFADDAVIELPAMVAPPLPPPDPPPTPPTHPARNLPVGRCR